MYRRNNELFNFACIEDKEIQRSKHEQTALKACSRYPKRELSVAVVRNKISTLSYQHGVYFSCQDSNPA